MSLINNKLIQEKKVKDSLIEILTKYTRIWNNKNKKDKIE